MVGVKIPALVLPRVIDQGVQRAFDAVRQPLQGLLDYVRVRPDGFADLSELRSFPTLPLDDGYRVWVRSEEDIYILYRQSTRVVDGSQIVQGQEGGLTHWVAYRSI